MLQVTEATTTITSAQIKRTALTTSILLMGHIVVFAFSQAVATWIIR